MKVAVPEGGGLRVPANCRAVAARLTGARSDGIALYDLDLPHLDGIDPFQADPRGLVEALA